jgi:hypothetical protein
VAQQAADAPARAAAQDPEPTTTLEAGDIYFFYRPRVGHDDPQGLEDVQRLFVILNPAQRSRYRLVVIGRKRLPEPDDPGQRRFWGFVDMVREGTLAIGRVLDEHTYHTRTRGERRQPASRLAGEGVYRIVRHGDHTHLAYELTLPTSPGEIQHDLGIRARASYIVTVKNPEAGSPPWAGLSESQQPHFPRRLHALFRGRRYAPLDPPDFLDYEGTEFILIAAWEGFEQERRESE